MDSRIDSVKKLSSYFNQIGKILDTAKYVINNEHDNEDIYYYELMTSLSRILPAMSEIVNNQIKK